MNTIKKLYCRTFQKIMKTALPLLPYRKPELLFRMKKVPELLRSLHCRSVLLVTDASIRACGITASLEDALKNAGIRISLFETVANPTTEVIGKAVKQYGKDRCEALIGFGGGSSIDTAKAAGALIVNPRKRLEQMSGILKVRRKLPPLIAIPTTAGTGSETTLAAVVTDSETRHKYPINDFPLIPHYAVLDPEVTRSLPPKMTSTTGMDALTHAVEAYIGNSTTEETRREALTAVRLIFRYIERAYQNGEDLQARKQMLLAAFLAGDAFSQSYVGYVHAVAHSLGGKYNVPHGLANSVLLPHVLEAYGSCIYPKLKDLAVAAGLAEEEENERTAAERFIEAVKEKNRRMDIPETIPEIRARDIPELAKKADAEANPLYPVPVLWGAEELEHFYYDVMETKTEWEPERKDDGTGHKKTAASAA